MTKEEFDTLYSLWNKLEDECMRVNHTLQRITKETKSSDFDGCYFADLPYDIDSDGVCCHGYSMNRNNLDTYYYYMPKELLAMSDEELNKWVDDEIAKYFKETEEKEKLHKEQDRARKEAEYERLRKELGKGE